MIEIHSRVLLLDLSETANRAFRYAANLRHAHTGGYDMLVMGGRGYGLIREILTGGTSQSVIRQCRIPVLIVPPTYGNAEKR